MRVLLPAHLQLPAGKFLEVTGKVQGDKSVRLVRARSRAAPRNAAQRRATPRNAWRLTTPPFFPPTDGRDRPGRQL